MISIPLIVALVLISVCVGLGGLLAAQYGLKLHQSRSMQSLVAFATGVLMALNFSEFLPKAFNNSVHLTPLFILFGVALVVVSETYIAPRLKFFKETPGHVHSENCGHSHSHHLISHHAACSAVGCLLVCAFFDGIQISSAFMMGSKLGWLTVLGLMFHVLPDGALASTLAMAGGMGVKSARVVTGLTALSMWLGVLFSSALKGLFDFNHYILPMTCGVLLYVTFVHLLPVALRARFGLFILLAGSCFILFGLHA